MLNTASQIGSTARIGASMMAVNRFDVQIAQPFAGHPNRHRCIGVRMYGLAIATPLDGNGKIAAGHRALDRGRVAEIGRLFAKSKGHDFRRDYIRVRKSA